jgi:hypothetical protein
VTLLPRFEESDSKWKIWTLTTWLAELRNFPEQEFLLKGPGKPIAEGPDLVTDVLVVGGGNAYAYFLEGQR